MSINGIYLGNRVSGVEINEMVTNHCCQVLMSI